MRPNLIRAHPFKRDAFLLVEPGVLEVVLAHRQLGSLDLEAGGILLGLRRGDHLHVIDLTTPGPGDKRSRTSFKRSQRHHLERALERWRESGCVIDYVGEWHTHPEPQPSPSSLDRSEWRAICAHRSDPMLFLIAGIGEELWAGVGLNSKLLHAPVPSVAEG